MENTEVEKSSNIEDGNQLNRNRSFKSKQLVRSQAIRESASPPRTVSPSVRSDDSTHARNAATNARVATIDSSHDGDYNCRVGGKQRVEIQITSNTWESETSGVRARARRDASETTRDLLSNNPRVACICGACVACPHCRGRRRKHKCPTKQDSGIVCSDDCPDNSDSEHNGVNELKKSASSSLDADEYYCRCAERKDKPKSISLSRTDSDDRSELYGPELVAFIKETLNKNGKDRAALLKIEKELHCFINDTGRCIVKFPAMTSYGRMLVHRCAALFQLAHHLDPANKACVVVSKNGTSGGRIPCTSFKTWCIANFPPSPLRHQPDPTLAKSILKRDSNSLDASGGGEGSLSRSKSLEQREKEYERVRRRIFSEENCHQDESQWPWMGAPIKLLTPEQGRNKLLKVQSLENPPSTSGAPPPQSWRGAVSKSHSFGGYGDRQPRALSRQGDLASSSWRLSPSSSGYKTLSLRSTDSVTPSPTGGASPEPVLWAVTDMAAVPVGALVIHPQTGRPLTNPDGTVYHFDPANPPVLYDNNVYVQKDSNKIDQNNEKRRGRLQKQHSFMDNENECRSLEECRNKCCCECRKQEQHDHANGEQTNNKENTKPPPSPVKPNTRNEPIVNKQSVSSTNRKPEQDASTNQRYDAQIRSYELANQREATRQDMVHYNPYTQNYNAEEVQNPALPYSHELTNMQMTKATPIPHDPNIRPMSIANVMYQPTMPTYAPYIHSQRLDAIPQQMYQPIMTQPLEEQKITSPPQHHDTGFRIDPSYPYPAVDYTGACGGCLETQPPRSYSVPYNHMEMPVQMLPTYPIHNVMPITHYPMQFPDVQWAPKLLPHYGLLYPQMVQQPPQLWACPGADKEPPSVACRVNNTPDVNDNMHNQTPMQTKITQMVEQMSLQPRRERRNTGHGILGDRPPHAEPYRPSGEGGQLSTAARAIVNSIRNMQNKNTYQQQDKRYDSQYRYNTDRRHRHDRDDKHGDRQHSNVPEVSGRGDGDRKPERSRVPTHITYRPPYLLRQMSPGVWCRRSPAPPHPALNQPRRAPPDNRPRR